MFKIYIGYDSREDIAYQVCKALLLLIAQIYPK